MNGQNLAGERPWLVANDGLRETINQLTPSVNRLAARKLRVTPTATPFVGVN